MNAFESDLDVALRDAPTVQVPPNFRQRLITRLPETPQTRQSWKLPVLAGLAALSFGALVLVALLLGFDHWLAQPSISLAGLIAATAVAVARLWRAVLTD